MPRFDVLVVGALAAGVHRHDDEVGPLVGLADERLRGGDPEQALRPGIRREADHGDPGAADVDVRDLAGPAGREQPGLPQRRDRVRLAGRAVVQRVVVREVHHGEPGVAEIRRVRGRRVEGEAVRARRAALGRAAVGERALEVAEHDVPGEVERDVAEVRLHGAGDHRDVAGEGEADGGLRCGAERSGPREQDDRGRQQEEPSPHRGPG